MQRLYLLVDEANQTCLKTLQPFFPPLEPLQSINLRAALFRLLIHVKNDGKLSGGAIVRRSMFDDCKGAHFENLLGEFSTLVVQKILVEDNTDRSIVKKAILTRSPSWRDRTALMTPLVIAYRSSLKTILNKRKEFSARCAKLSKLLSSKGNELSRKHRTLSNCIASWTEKNIPKRIVDKLERHIHADWRGNSRWVNVLIRGEVVTSEDRLLDRSFDSAWTYTCKDQLGEIRQGHQVTLLQELGNRLEEQNKRLERWKMIKNDLVNEKIVNNFQNKDQFERSPSHSLPVTGKRPMGSALSSLITRAVQINNQQHTVVLPTQSGNSTSEIKVHAPETRMRTRSSGARASINKAKSYQPESLVCEQAYLRMLPQDAPRNTKDTRGDHSLLEKNEKSADQLNGCHPMVDVERSLTQLSKPTLAERTRLSMAFASPLKSVPQPEPHEPPLLSQLPTPNTTPSDMLPAPAVMDDLLERTRKSMSSMSLAARALPLLTSPKRRRSNVYPTNQFATPEKEGESSVLYDFSPSLVEADQAVVFKSRPKIAISPTLKAWGEDEEGWRLKDSD